MTASEREQELPETECFDFHFELLVIDIHLHKSWWCLVNRWSIYSVNIPCGSNHYNPTRGV